MLKTNKYKEQEKGFIAITLVFIMSFSVLLMSVAAISAVNDHLDLLSREEVRAQVSLIESSCEALKIIHSMHNPWDIFRCNPISFIDDNFFTII